MPIVSIVIPTYERLDYLKEAVASVVAQTFTDWELIVVDDGSTDGSVEWLELLDDERLIVIACEHSGNRSRLRNLGATRGTGEWIAFLDSDDLWNVDKLTQQLAALAARPDRRWSCTGISFVDANSAAIEQRGATAYRAHSGWILDKLLTFAAAVPTPTLMVARSLFAEIGGFDETVLWREDYDFALRLAARAEIHALPDVLTVVRHHSGRTSSNRRVADLHRATEVVLRRAGAMTKSRRIRRLALRQAALQIASQSRANSMDGDHAGALHLIGRALLADPFTWQLWRVAAGCVRRALRQKLARG